MRIIKSILIVFLFVSQLLQAQLHSGSDTIHKSVNMKNVFNKVSDEFVERYYFTQKDVNGENKRDKEEFGCGLISDYKLKKLSLKVIPRFKLLKGYDLSKNIADFLDIEQDDYRSFFYTIYHKDTLLTTAYSVIKNKTIMSSILLNCSSGQFLDNNIAYMMQLGFQEHYFLFQIENMRGVFFIVEKGIVYALYWPRNSQDYKKTEINEFFRNNKIKIENFDSESVENKAIKDQQAFFNKSYFLNIRTE